MVGGGLAVRNTWASWDFFIEKLKESFALLLKIEIIKTNGTEDFDSEENRCQIKSVELMFR